MKKRSAGRRRFYHFHRRSGPMHAAASLAQVAANFYFRLSSGTAEQREAAEEWRALFMEIPRLLKP